MCPYNWFWSLELWNTPYAQYFPKPFVSSSQCPRKCKTVMIIWLYCRYIHSKNRSGLSYKLDVNHLADRTEKEMKKMRGYRYTHGDHGGKKFTLEAMKVQDVPDQWDWRLIGEI